MSLDTRFFTISFHDLAPHTQPICQQFLKDLKALGINKTSLLAVPFWHYREPLNRYPDFLRWLKSVEQDGHEICLHGYYHKADEVKGGPWRQLMGRIYTNSEGEFYQLPYDSAYERLERGVSLLRSAGLTVDGFTAPAWLLSPDSRRALCDLGFLYTTTWMHFDLLETEEKVFAPALAFSCRTALRRNCSKRWVRFWYWLQQDATILRLAVHPADLLYPSIRAMILSLVERAVQLRSPLSYRDLAYLEMLKLPRVQNEKRLQVNP